MSSLVSRDAASALTPPGAASSPSAASSSAPGARAPTPQAPTLSGFRLPKRKVDYVVVDQPVPSAKKRKEDTAAAPPSAKKGGGSTRTSPARSPSRGQERHHREESAPMAPLALEVPAPGSADEVPKALEPSISHAQVTTSPPPSAALLAPGSSASSVVLEHALSEMAQLQEDLLSADPRLVVGRPELASGWLHSDAAVRATLNQAVTASEEEKQATAKAAADHEAALEDAKATRDRCRVLDDELKSLRDQHAEETRGRQAKEEEMKAREDAIRSRDAELVELAKAQAAEHSRLKALDQEAKRSSVALKSLYEKGLEKPLTTNEDGPAQLLPLLVKALEEVVEGIGPMTEAEAHVLSSPALTRVFSHLYLRNPNARLSELLEPVADEHCAAAAVAVKVQVEAQLKKFRGFVIASSTGDASDPAAGGAAEDDTTKGRAPSTEDLRGADPRLVAGRLELVSSWLHSDVAVRAALNQAAVGSEKDKQAVAQATAAHEAALKDAGDAQDRCQSLEAELETMRNERAAKARGREVDEEKMKAWEDAVRDRDAELEQLAKAQAAEGSRLEKLKRKMEAEKAELDAKAKVLAEDRVAFNSLEEKARTALRSLYEKGLEEPLATADEGPTELLPYLVTVLEEVLLEPMDDEHYAATAKAVKGQVEALLKRFRAFNPAPSTRGAADPATPAGDAGEGNAAMEETSLADVGGVRE
nr:FYVE and coiled-coil domain-containing protein 1-like [Aegilops tauschii subsp. strangulata]